MTNQEAIKMLTAKVECIRRETSGTDIDCNLRNCDGCELCYAQGVTGEQRKALNMAISALKVQTDGNCISRQAAIDALWEIRQEEISDGRRFHNHCSLSTAVDVIKDLPSAEPESQWIPVSERLPDVAQRVLLSGHGTVMVGMLHSFGKYSLEPTGISYTYPKDDIDAWMPLPEPYRAERKVDEGSD